MVNYLNSALTIDECKVMCSSMSSDEFSNVLRDIKSNKVVNINSLEFILYAIANADSLQGAYTFADDFNSMVRDYYTTLVSNCAFARLSAILPTMPLFGRIVKETKLQYYWYPCETKDGQPIISSRATDKTTKTTTNGVVFEKRNYPESAKGILDMYNSMVRFFECMDNETKREVANAKITKKQAREEKNAKILELANQGKTEGIAQVVTYYAQTYGV